jgi:hypothetical protein
VAIFTPCLSCQIKNGQPGGLRAGSRLEVIDDYKLDCKAKLATQVILHILNAAAHTSGVEVVSAYSANAK